MPITRVIIATSQRSKTLFRMLVLLLLICGVDALLIPGYTAQAWSDFFKQRAMLIGMPIAAFLFSTVGIWFSLTSIFRVLFQGGRAVWIEKGNIIYITKFNFSVAQSDVSSIKDGISERTGSPCVFINTKDGEQKVIPTYLLAEESEDIAARLRQYLSVG